jgi:mono/diheme cytochrome c family protein
MNKPNTSIFVKLFLAAIIFSACRGMPSKKPPIHPNQNMDFGNQFEAQEANPFFKDGRGMRTPVAGTVARGFLNADSKLHEGVDLNGQFIKRIPLTVDKAFIERGQNQFNIYCSPCHGGLGDGRGMIVSFGLVPPPNYHDDRLRNIEDGYIFNVATNGIRSMRGYKSQIPVDKDRWAIVAYIRALQKSQYATESDLGGYELSDTEKTAHLAKEALVLKEKEAAAKALASISTEELVTKGKALFTSKTCSTCHSLDGTKIIGPSFKNAYGRKVEFTDGTSTTADEAYLTESIKNSNAKIVKDYIPAMPNFNDLLTDVEVKALVEYIKTVK